VLEADHSSPPSADVKNSCRSTSTSPYVFVAWCLIKHRATLLLICFVFILTALLLQG